MTIFLLFTADAVAKQVTINSVAYTERQAKDWLSMQGAFTQSGYLGYAEYLCRDIAEYIGLLCLEDGVLA